LRGFDQRQILITIDGAPIQVPYDGQLDLGKFPLGLVDHVTVVKGSGSLLLGPNGLGGAVDVATRRAGEGPMLSLAAETAPFSAERLSAVASGNQGPVGLLAGAAYENVLYYPLSDSFAPTFNEGGGRRENSDRRSLSFLGKARWQVDEEQEVAASLWRLDGRFGVPPGVYDLSRRFWRWTDWHVDTYTVAHGYRGEHLTTDETLYISMVGNTLDIYDGADYHWQELPASGTSVYDDRVMGGNARIAYRFSCRDRCVTARGWVGGKRDIHRARDKDDAPWIEVGTTTISVAGQVDGPLGEPASWLVGTQVDAEFPDAIASGVAPKSAMGVGPMAALNWQPGRMLDMTASVAHRTRFPTLKERFSSAFGLLAPNPALSPERATNTSVDATFRPIEGLRVDVGIFESEVTDLVVQVPREQGMLQWQNTGRARIYGIESVLLTRPTPGLEMWGGWAAMNTRRLDGPAERIAYRPEHKATVAISWLPVSWLHLTLMGRYVGAQYFQNPDTSRWGRLGSSRMLDARLEVLPLESLRLWVRGTNLTDANVQGHYSYPEPGRQVFTGLSLEWPEKKSDQGWTM